MKTYIFLKNFKFWPCRDNRNTAVPVLMRPLVVKSPARSFVIVCFPASFTEVEKPPVFTIWPVFRVPPALFAREMRAKNEADETEERNPRSESHRFVPPARPPGASYLCLFKRLFVFGLAARPASGARRVHAGCTQGEA